MSSDDSRRRRDQGSERAKPQRPSHKHGKRIDASEARRVRRPAGERYPPQLIWARPEPDARRAGLTRARIAAAALRIADADGLDAVSMRRVAAEIGVGTMTLYHYLRDKDELVDLMHDAMMGEVLVPTGELPSDWRGALEVIARQARQMYLRHPWSLSAPLAAAGPNGMRHMEQSLAAVRGLAVDFATRAEIILMVDDYVFGFLLREAGQAQRSASPMGDDGWRNAVVDYFTQQFDSGEFPQIERFVGDDPPRTVINRLIELSADETRFERGIARLLDGIALDLERRGIHP
jgi:AcrR family transcriptional regulator